ncbi:MAG: hypothetical protein KDI38_03580 [Calditrichaeota bacterium]|nr:hypothetical protein [Calditrichota bacterium]
MSSKQLPEHLVNHLLAVGDALKVKQPRDGRIKLVGSLHMTQKICKSRRKTFRERWLSSPWEPWFPYFTFYETIPSQELTRCGNIVIGHPDYLKEKFGDAYEITEGTLLKVTML